MITVTLKESTQTVDLSTRTTSPISIDNKLDTSLDSGTLNYLKTEQDGKGLSEPLAGYTVGIGGKTFEFIGMDSRALLRKNVSGQNIYKHQVSLTEPSKLLQGVLIDGFGVSQPEDYEKRQTLLEVADRLLATTPFDGQTFVLTNDDAVKAAMSAVKSPEFKWNTQTTLWECLLQIGAVIDAMPRLVSDSNGNYTVVTFEFVNTYGNAVENISDQWTNADGQNVEENQYNTTLRSLVENLREN